MKICDLNPHGGIGANCFYVEIEGFKLVVDCGMHPKFVGRDSLPRIQQIPEGEVDLVIVTHCHLDHLGALPVLLRYQPQARLIMSRASAILAPRMMHNSVNVMGRQREELGDNDLPLYTHMEIDEVEHRILPMTFGHPRRLTGYSGREVEVTLFAAGHVAGAAGVRLRVGGRVIFFTGDVLFTDQETLPGADFPREKVDTLILETTRGANARIVGNTRESEVERLLDTIAEVIDGGGSVLIPTFALGRMQEIMTILDQARKQGRIPYCPVHASGLGLDLANYFDDISKRTGDLNFRRKTVKDLGVKSIPRSLTPGRSPHEPSLFIVSSGMLVPHTPSYKVAASLLPHRRNAVLFVGYCDPDTPGGELVAAEDDATFVFDEIDFSCLIHARRERFDLSGHADREELVDFALDCDPRAIVLSHGDDDARAWFMDTLNSQANGHLRVHNPVALEPLEV